MLASFRHRSLSREWNGLEWDDNASAPPVDSMPRFQDDPRSHERIAATSASFFSVEMEFNVERLKRAIDATPGHPKSSRVSRGTHLSPFPIASRESPWRTDD